MQIRHPRALDDGEPPGVAIDVDGTTVVPDEEGHYDIGDRRRWLEQYAAANDVAPDALRVDEATCETVKGDGEVCGRELPCPYHSSE